MGKIKKWAGHVVTVVIGVLLIVWLTAWLNTSQLPLVPSAGVAILAVLGFMRTVSDLLQMATASLLRKHASAIEDAKAVQGGPQEGEVTVKFRPGGRGWRRNAKRRQRG